MVSILESSSPFFSAQESRRIDGGKKRRILERIKNILDEFVIGKGYRFTYISAS
jgi:hypothetical protein